MSQTRCPDLVEALTRHIDKISRTTLQFSVSDNGWSIAQAIEKGQAEHSLGVFFIVKDEKGVDSTRIASSRRCKASAFKPVLPNEENLWIEMAEVTQTLSNGDVKKVTAPVSLQKAIFVQYDVYRARRWTTLKDTFETTIWKGRLEGTKLILEVYDAIEGFKANQCILKIEDVHPSVDGYRQIGTMIGTFKIRTFGCDEDLFMALERKGRCHIVGILDVSDQVYFIRPTLSMEKGTVIPNLPYVLPNHLSSRPQVPICPQRFVSNTRECPRRTEDAKLEPGTPSSSYLSEPRIKNVDSLTSQQSSSSPHSEAGMDCNQLFDMMLGKGPITSLHNIELSPKKVAERFLDLDIRKAVRALERYNGRLGIVREAFNFAFKTCETDRQKRQQQIHAQQREHHFPSPSPEGPPLYQNGNA